LRFSLRFADRVKEASMPNHDIRDANLRLLLMVPRLLALADDIREEYTRLVGTARSKEEEGGPVVAETADQRPEASRA
jgi:hypothetical protein